MTISQRIQEHDESLLLKRKEPGKAEKHEKQKQEKQKAGKAKSTKAEKQKSREAEKQESIEPGTPPKKTQQQINSPPKLSSSRVNLVIILFQATSREHVLGAPSRIRLYSGILSKSMSALPANTLLRMSRPAVHSRKKTDLKRWCQDEIRGPTMVKLRSSVCRSEVVRRNL